MSLGIRWSTIALCASLCLVAPVAFAGDPAASAVSAEQMDEAIASKVNRDGDARASVLTLLQRPEVKAMAAGYGLDVRGAEAAVGTLEGAELETLAAHAAQADAALVGGDTVRIGLVAALLIVIIVILVAN